MVDHSILLEPLGSIFGMEQLCNGSFHIFLDELSKYKLIHWCEVKLSPFRRHFQMHFPQWKMYEFHLRFNWSLFLRFELTLLQHWFRYCWAVHHLFGPPVPDHRKAPPRRPRLCRWPSNVAIIQTHAFHKSDCLGHSRHWKLHGEVNKSSTDQITPVM